MQNENKSIPTDESTRPWIKAAVIATIVIALGGWLLRKAGLL